MFCSNIKRSLNPMNGFTKSRSEASCHSEAFETPSLTRKSKAES